MGGFAERLREKPPDRFRPRDLTALAGNPAVQRGKLIWLQADADERPDARFWPST
jgi:hypothetical protein